MQKWLIPCNINNYDIVKHFSTHSSAYFKKNRDLTVGDEVYIYVAKPYAEIKYKGNVIKTGIKPNEVGKEYKISCSENKSFVLIELTKIFPDKSFTIDNLRKNGLGQVTNQQLIRGNLEEYISNIENNL